MTRRPDTGDGASRGAASPDGGHSRGRLAGRLPADLWAVVALTLATAVTALAPVLRDSPLRVALGIAFLLFAPGWVLVAALFPEGHRGGDPGDINALERALLAVGTSLAVVPLVVLALHVTPWGVTLGPLLVVVGGGTLMGTAVAARRRAALSPTERLVVPIGSWPGRVRAALFEPASRADAALNIVLVVSVVFAGASVAWALGAPGPTAPYTELYLLTEDEGGDLVATDYPTELVEGEGHPVVVGVQNHEGAKRTYTVVVELQRVERTNGTVGGVEATRQLHRNAITLDDGERWEERHQIVPTMNGTRLRLAVMLYEGEAPADPSIAGAGLSNQLWVNVSAAP